MQDIYTHAHACLAHMALSRGFLGNGPADLVVEQNCFLLTDVVVFSIFNNACVHMLPDSMLRAY